jgi:hypothetical protein
MERFAFMYRPSPNAPAFEQVVSITYLMGLDTVDMLVCRSLFDLMQAVEAGEADVPALLARHQLTDSAGGDNEAYRRVEFTYHEPDDGFPFEEILAFGRTHNLDLDKLATLALLAYHDCVVRQTSDPTIMAQFELGEGDETGSATVLSLAGRRKPRRDSGLE